MLCVDFPRKKLVPEPYLLFFSKKLHAFSVNVSVLEKWSNLCVQTTAVEN